MLFPTLLKERLSTHPTLIACGAARGGTTALAYALVRAGIDLGPSLPLNLEDDRFVRCFTPSNIDANSLRDLLSIRRNELWGFKVPEAIFHLRWLDRNVPNPVFIIVFRSPLGVANSAISHDPANFSPDRNGLVNALEHSLTCYSAALQALPFLKSPVLMIDYESLHFRAEETLSWLFETLEVDCEDIHSIAGELSKVGYKSMEP